MKYLNTENGNISEITFEISNVCNNNCAGCIYSKDLRRSQNFMDFDIFKNNLELFIKKLELEGRKSVILVLGTGDNFFLPKEVLFKYIDIMADMDFFKSQENHKALDITITLNSSKDLYTFMEWEKYINLKIPNNFENSYDLVIDLMKNKKQLRTVKTNLDFLYKRDPDLDMDFVVKYNKLYFNMDFSILVDKIEFLGIDNIIFDFVMKDENFNRKLGEYYEFSEWIIKFYDYLIKNNKTHIMSNLRNHLEKLDNDNKDNLKILEKINLDLQCYYVDINSNILNYVTTANGNLLLFKNFKIENTLFKNSKIENIDFNELKNLNDNLLLLNNKNEEINPICNQCEYSKLCPSYLITEISKKFDINMNNDFCLYGKQILNKIYSDKKIKDYSGKNYMTEFFKFDCYDK